MEQANVYIAKLLPSQEAVRRSTLLITTNIIRRGMQVPPAIVVPLSEGSGTYIVADGHHKLRARHDLGMREATVNILMTDRDVMASIAGWLLNYDTLAEARQEFMNRQRIMSGRVGSIAAMDVRSDL